MTVDVKVHPTVREFILDTNGGNDIIIPQKDDWIWLVLKQHLITVPASYVPTPTEAKEACIRVALLNASGTKVYAADRKRAIYPNQLYRCFLSQKGQRVIADHLRTSLKECFHNFVQGATFGNPNLQAKEAIEDFCQLHRLSMGRVTYDMLVKSWQRSRQRQKIKTLSSDCPIIF